MARFWLATFELAPSPAAAPAADNAAAVPILAAESRKLAIEVLGDEARSEYAVLFSTVDDPKQPRTLKCRIGFANVAKASSVWRDRGFPLVDATIVRDEAGKISVFSPHFRDDPPMQYESLMFAMTGIVFEPQPGAKVALETRYEQTLEAPDGAQPDTLITRRAVTWTPERSDTYRLKPGPFQLEVARIRCPSLAPMATGRLTPASAWSGDVRLPQDQEGKRGPILGRVSRADIFGPPAFRFEDVEVLGFRVDLGAYGRDFTRELDELIKPLNFHLEGARGVDAIWDFRYRAATPTLLIELLRYGKMKLKSPSPPLGREDYQSQHELVVRLLVGRVDDDTAQAHAPATYVPAIFVDNPWSKVLGRDVQGFDKRMASFCVPRDGGHAPLLPDGCVAGDVGAGGVAPGAGERKPRPLRDISLVRLVKETGSPAGPKILELDCSPLKYEDVFVRIDLGLALSSLSLVGTRWRQSDFEAAEFRRTFARSAVMESLTEFRSIQVSPVADRGLEKAWITGVFTVDDDLRIALPFGVASLTIHAVPPDPYDPSAPSTSKYWNLLCRMLGDGGRAEISLSTGSWYRLLCSMDLTIDDGLDWSRANF